MMPVDAEPHHHRHPVSLPLSGVSRDGEIFALWGFRSILFFVGLGFHGPDSFGHGIELKHGLVHVFTLGIRGSRQIDVLLTNNLAFVSPPARVRAKE